MNRKPKRSHLNNQTRSQVSIFKLTEWYLDKAYVIVNFYVPSRQLILTDILSVTFALFSVSAIAVFNTHRLDCAWLMVINTWNYKNQRDDSLIF